MPIPRWDFSPWQLSLCAAAKQFCARRPGSGINGDLMDLFPFSSALPKALSLYYMYYILCSTAPPSHAKKKDAAAAARMRIQ